MTTANLLARDAEVGAIDRLLTAARRGSGGALVVRGEVGIGKTALVEYAIAASMGMLILRVAGVQAEMNVDFAGVHQLVAPILNGLADLSARRREALESAFGGAGVTDRLHVGIALLSLLAKTAQKQPVVCIVDDAQYLDETSADVLGLVARRVGGEPICFVFAIVDPTAQDTFGGLPELRLDGLPSWASRQILTAGISVPLAGRVRERVVAETYGNPFALLELSHELTSAQLAGESVLPRSLPLSARHEAGLMRRLRGLPDETLVFLLLVAAQPDGDSDVILRAAELLGLGKDAAGPAKAEGLLRMGSSAEFRTQFVGAAVYGAASPQERRAAHSALAASTDQDADPDGYAWHCAEAAVAPDEEVAAALERAAGRAGTSRGRAGAAALFERAAKLTPDPHRRVDRNLAAVRAELDSGSAERAGAMLDAADDELMDDLQRARAHRLRVQIEVEAGTAADPHAMLLDVARAFEPLDPLEARDVHLEALKAGLDAGRAGVGAVVQSVLRVPESEVGARDLFLDGFSSLFSTGRAGVAPMFRRAIELLRGDDDLESLALGCHAAVELWDDQALHELTTHREKLARSSGALFGLRRALLYRGGAYEVIAGRFDVAERCLDEAEEIAAATLSPPLGDRVGPGRLILAVWRGNEIAARRLAETIHREATARGDLVEAAFTHYAIAVLEIGLGRYRAGLSSAREASLGETIVVNTWTLPELVEAAARSGEFEEAAAAAERLADSALGGATDWGLGMLARSRALASQNGRAEELYEEAIDRLGRSRALLHFARAKLVYGEWLRRERRRRDAREQLRAAHELFSSMGATAFAARARAELLATGEHARRWSVETTNLLTPQETRIAHLVAEGAGNGDIAAQLFISPRTVEYHLSKVFRKLDVSSRTQLTRLLLERDRTPPED